jgi:hypothetical protein
MKKLVGVLPLGVCLAQVGWADVLVVCGSTEPTSSYYVRGEDQRPKKASISAIVTIDVATEETELFVASKSVPIIGNRTIYFDSLMIEEDEERIVSGFNESDIDNEGDFYSLVLSQEKLHISLAEVALSVSSCMDMAVESEESSNQAE